MKVKPQRFLAIGLKALLVFSIFLSTVNLSQAKTLFEADFSGTPEPAIGSAPTVGGPFSGDYIITKANGKLFLEGREFIGVRQIRADLKAPISLGEDTVVLKGTVRIGASQSGDSSKIFIGFANAGVPTAGSAFQELRPNVLFTEIHDGVTVRINGEGNNGDGQVYRFPLGEEIAFEFRWNTADSTVTFMASSSDVEKSEKATLTTEGAPFNSEELFIQFRSAGYDTETEEGSYVRPLLVEVD